MKNILNKIGAVSRPMLFGAALGVATIAVGVGVATNFMGGSPKGNSGRVLSQYSADGERMSYGAGSSSYEGDISKEALEQRLALNQAAMNKGSSLDYLAAAGKGKFALKEGERPSGVIDPMAEGGAGYEGQDYAAADNGAAGNGVKQFDKLAAAANKNAGKNKEGKEGADGAAAAAGKAGVNGQTGGTQTNKLRTSSGFGGSSFGGAKGGSGSRSMGQIQGYAGDSASVAIKAAQVGAGPQGNIKNVADKNAAKYGRVGQMGGNSARGGNGAQGGHGQSYYSSSLGELAHASRYSDLARGTVNEDVEKGYVDAGAAFDGSGEVGSGVQVDGSTPINQRAAALERAGSKINNKFNSSGLDDKMDQITEDSNTVSKAKKGIMSTVMMLISTAIVGVGLVMAFKNFAWWGKAAALIIAGVFAAVIIGLGMGLLGMYVNQIKHVATAELADPGAWGHMRYWLPPLIGALPFLGLFAGEKTLSTGGHALSGLAKALLMGGGFALLSSLGGLFGGK